MGYFKANDPFDYIYTQRN